MRFKIFSIMVLLALSLNLHSLTISLAPINYVVEGVGPDEGKSKEMQKKLFQNIRFLSRWKSINYQRVSNSHATPQRTLEAMALCSEEGYEFLLYGFIEKRKFSLYAEIKLLDFEARDMVMVFYAIDNHGEEERLLEDLAKKISSWFAEIYKLGPIPGQTSPTEGIISFALGAGPWSLLTAEWAETLNTPVMADLRVRFTPFRPAPGFRFSSAYFKTGLEGILYYSQNQPLYEESKLFGIGIGIPLGVSWDWGVLHTVGFNFTSQFFLDYLLRERLHDQLVSTLAPGFGISFDMEYAYHINKSFSMGVIHRFALQNYSPARIGYSINIFGELSLKPLNGGSNE